MRITAGKARGRRLKPAAGRSSLRPTASKVREAVFDIIGPGLKGARFLDLYAGTGAVGLEALSRGAETAVFVEISQAMAERIRRAGREFGLSAQMKVYRRDALDYLKRAEGGSFDFVFADPPYRSGEVTKVLSLVPGVLKAEGMVIVEHPSKMVLPESVGPLRRKKRYTYGDTALTTFYIPEPSDDRGVDEDGGTVGSERG